MISAEEARKQAVKVKENELNEEIAAIETCIKGAIQKGQMTVSIYNHVHQSTKDVLIECGYVLYEHDNQYDGYELKISWERKKGMKKEVIPMNDDLISRQAAIDALNDDAELLRRALDDTDVVGADRAKFEWGLGIIESYIYDMKELPSAQPERKKGKWMHDKDDSLISG